MARLMVWAGPLSHSYSQQKTCMGLETASVRCGQGCGEPQSSRHSDCLPSKLTCHPPEGLCPAGKMNLQDSCLLNAMVPDLAKVFPLTTIVSSSMGSFLMESTQGSPEPVKCLDSVYFWHCQELAQALQTEDCLCLVC